MTAPQHPCLRSLATSGRLSLGPTSFFVPAPPLSRCRTPLSSLRPPWSCRPPLLKKRSGAAGVVKEDGKVALHEEAVQAESEDHGEEPQEYVATVSASHPVPTRLRVGQAGDPVFFLLTAVAISMSMAFMSLVAVAIPTMLAMKRAANSFCMLADAAIEELPSTMAAVRLSGMEISDLTLELSDLSHEVADCINKTAKVAEAVKAGIGQMRGIASQKTKSMIKERANLQTIPSAKSDEVP